MADLGHLQILVCKGILQPKNLSKNMSNYSSGKILKIIEDQFYKKNSFHTNNIKTYT